MASGSTHQEGRGNLAAGTPAPDFALNRIPARRLARSVVDANGSRT